MSTSWSLADMPDQTGQTILVTGASSGLGLASAEALASKGARVLLGCRNPSKGKDVPTQVSAAATGAEPVLVTLDLADLASVTACAEETATLTPHLDVLMNNAGVMALPQSKTVDGFEMQFGTNHLGHFALTGRLLPLLLAADAPRVVITSSGAHKPGRMHWDDLDRERRYRKWMVYAQSKLANLLFMFELDRRSAASGAQLVSVAGHPGYASTHLQAAGPQMTGSRFKERIMVLGNRLFAQSAEAGALPQLYAATDPTVRSGEYYGPDGLGEMRGAPKLVKAKKAAHDPESGRRLWEISEELTGVTYAWD